MPEELAHSSRRLDEIEEAAWPVLSQHALDLSRPTGEELHAALGEFRWEAGEPTDLHLVLAGGVLLVDRREEQVVFVIEPGDFVGELGMLMGQCAVFQGAAMEGTTILWFGGEELRRLVEIRGAERCPAVRFGCPAAIPEQDWRGWSGTGRRRRPRVASGVGEGSVVISAVHA
ncbi:cyclic nucleotide-binding domain-containing protein [Amycolatopsis sp. NPDC101161]|uniref:cyclic nucleotide-binding domain-containing protein n=1 Tax=Amycolatopsis sp. NPDC101161 TaxID=3363940 RepID=UPI0037F3CF96